MNCHQFPELNLAPISVPVRPTPFNFPLHQVDLHVLLPRKVVFLKNSELKLLSLTSLVMYPVWNPKTFLTRMACVTMYGWLFDPTSLGIEVSFHNFQSQHCKLIVVVDHILNISMPQIESHQSRHFSRSPPYTMVRA